MSNQKNGFEKRVTLKQTDDLTAGVHFSLHLSLSLVQQTLFAFTGGLNYSFNRETVEVTWGGGTKINTHCNV